MRTAVPDLSPRTHPARAIHWLTALGMILALGMFAFGGKILLDARADAWQQAESASQNLVLALARDIARNVTMYDLSLQGTQEALAQPDLDQVSPETRQMTLFNRAATTEDLGAMIVLNPNGDIVADSTSIVPHQFNFSDREQFSAHKARADVGLFISRPFRSQMRGGDLSIALSRRLNHADGSFGGVVIATLRLAYFKNLFAKLDLGATGSVTLFRSDGRVIMRLPFRDADVDRDLGDTTSFRRYLEARSGTVVGKATLDGIDRLYSFRHVDNLPLVLSVAVGLDEIYAAWWRKAAGIGSVLTLLCGTTVMLCLLFRREMLRRLNAEHDLRDAAEQLAVIATTDALTSLPNRRSFEDRLSLEWLRSIRTEASIALLILDADFFKLYNDRYGHPEGDQVLRSIADCIAANVLRPGDLGARYGGEEFVVLLPETEISGALVVAERMRAAVAELNIPHAGHPDGHVTVSIGVAVARPLLGEAQLSLVTLADAALYDAKRAGRNRVSMTCPDNLLQMNWQPSEPADRPQ